MTNQLSQQQCPQHREDHKVQKLVQRIEAKLAAQAKAIREQTAPSKKLAMTVGKGKRPRDPNQLAAWTVAVSTGQIPAPEAEPPKITGSASPASISEYMAAIGRKGGQIGGKRRLKTNDRSPAFQGCCQGRESTLEKG